MQNMIVVDLNGFSLEKNITIIQKDKENVITKARIGDMAEYCANLVCKYGVQCLKVLGPASFAPQIASDIRDVAKKEYNYSLLEIEVITK